MINKLAKEIHQNAINKGFFEKEKNIGEMLCLIHSEVSEALEADRKNKYANLQVFQERHDQILRSYSIPSTQLDDHDFITLFKTYIKDTFEDEMIDQLIRILDLCAFKGIDIEKHTELKMRYNSLREKYHGKKY